MIFPSRPAHEQREILRDVIKKVVVSQDNIKILYFGANREETLPRGKAQGPETAVSDRPESPKADSGRLENYTSMSSGVRSVSKVVEVRRFELLTLTLPA